MADEPQSPGTGTEGQAGSEPAAAPSPATGSAEQGQTQDQGQAAGTPTATEEPSFFDINLLPPEQREALMPGYKQMQAAFTRKTQEIATHRQKIEAFDRFQSDPNFQIQVVQEIARNQGYTLTRAQAKDVLNQQAESGEDWQPNTWQEVLSRAKDMARQEIMEELKPVLQNVQSMRADSIEKQLDSIDSNWRVYEDEMRKNLQLAPALINDPVKLYKFSVPDEVLEARATQKALARFDAKSKAAAVGGKTETSKGIPADEKVTDFASAAAAAKRRISEGR